MSKVKNVEFSPEFLDAIKSITNISSAIGIQHTEDEIVIAQRSEGKEINVRMTAPKSSFNYDKDFGISDFPNFYSVYKVLNGQGTVGIDVNEVGSDDHVEAASLTVANEDTSIEYGLSNMTRIGAGKKKENGFKDFTTIEIPEDVVKNIQVLTKALVVSPSSAGTKLSILSEAGSNNVSLKFESNVALGNSFTREFEGDNEALEVKLVFDPFFFTWLPANDYKLKIVVADGEVAKVNHIVATGIIRDADGNEVCTQNFTAGKLRVPYID
jgi:hypothetical protein